MAKRKGAPTPKGPKNLAAMAATKMKTKVIPNKKKPGKSQKGK